eukprot:g6974.t1
MPIRELSLELVHDIVESYGQITKLNLSTNEISRVEHLELLTCLTSLDLFCNHLGSLPGSLDGLSPLTSLRDLDISENSITSLEPLSSAPVSLVRLNVANNSVSDVGQVSFLASLTALTELVLAGNPMTAHEDYRGRTLTTLPSLAALDHTPRVDPRDHHDANADSEGLQPRSAQTLPTGVDAASRGTVLEPQAEASPPQTTPPPDSSGPAPDSAAPPVPLTCDGGSGPTAASFKVEATPRQDGVVERQDRSENRSPEPASALPVPGSSGSVVSVPLSTGVVRSAEAEELSPIAEGGGGVGGGRVFALGSGASVVPRHSEEIPGSRLFEAGKGESSPNLRDRAAILPEDAPRAPLGAARAAALQGCDSLFGSVAPVEATTTGGVPEEKMPGTAAAAPAPRRFSTNATDKFAGSQGTYAPEAGAGRTLEQVRDSQRRSDYALPAAAPTLAGPATTTTTATQVAYPFPFGGDRSVDRETAEVREESRAPSGAVPPPAQLPGVASRWDGTLEGQRSKTGGFLHSEAAGGGAAYYSPGMQAESFRVEGERYGAASCGDRQAVLSAAVAATTTPFNTGSFQVNRDAASRLSRTSDMFSRRGLTLDCVAKHDERPRPAHPTAVPHNGLDAARNPARREGINDASLLSRTGGAEVLVLPLQGAAPRKVGAVETSVGGQALQPAPVPVEGWSREGEGQMVVTDRGEWEALRRENDDLRRQAALSDKRCAALVEMQRLADEALSSAHPPLLSSAKPLQRREGSTGAFSLSSSSSSSAEEGSEDHSRDRSGEQGREDGEGVEGTSAGEQEQPAGAAKLLAAWRAEVLKLLLQRGVDAEVAAAESREARRKVAEEQDARGRAETEARSLTQRALAAEAEAELSGIKLARACEELREERAGRFVAEASSSGFNVAVRGLHEWVQGFVGLASEGFFEREALLARGVAKLEAFSERLAQAAGRIEVLGTLLRHKEVQLRNSRAALVADRRVWLLERQDREMAALSKTSLHDGGGGGGGGNKVEVGRAATMQCPLLEGLRPECEAVMRALFCRVDRLGTGAVRARRLLEILRSDCGVSEVMEAAVGKPRWRAALDSMEAALCPPLVEPSAPASGVGGVGGARSSNESAAAVRRVERDVTWGEFLLFFLPSAGRADDAYNAGLVSVSHAGGSSGDGCVPGCPGVDRHASGGYGGARQISSGFGAVSEDAAAMLQMVVPAHWNASAEAPSGEGGREAGESTRRNGGATLGRGLAALSVGQLRREVQRLAKERAFLLALVREDGRLGRRRAGAVHDQYRHELRTLHTKIGELERSLEDSSRRTEAEHERGAALQEEVSDLREEMAKAEQEWKRRLDAAVQEKAAALAESSREASKAATTARERISRLEAEHSLALRENGKVAVRQRALERELARIKTSMHAEAALEKDALEERLRAGEAKLATARRERNALLAALRDLQRRGRSSGSDPVFSLPAADLGSSQGRGGMTLDDLGEATGVCDGGCGSGVGAEEGPRQKMPPSGARLRVTAQGSGAEVSGEEAAPDVVVESRSKGLKGSPMGGGGESDGVLESRSSGGRVSDGAWQVVGVEGVGRGGSARAATLSARLELLALQTQQLLEDGSDTSYSSSSDDSVEDETGTPNAAPREDERRSKKDKSVPFDPSKDSLVVREDTKPSTSSRRRSSRESRRHSNSRGSRGTEGGSAARKKSADTSADRPSLEGIFNESDDADSGSDIFDVEGWQVPSVLVERASAAGNGLRFSLSVSFYHAGSKRFFGDTFMGELLDEEDEERVEVVSERRQGSSPATKRSSRKKQNTKRLRGKKRGGNRRQAREGLEDDNDDDDDDDDDEDQEMEVTTRHEEIVYWYTGFEDPNCIAVVELVATVMDTVNGIQEGQYGCGWTFIQFFGPNEPEAVQHRDVYRGSPRNLLFFEQGDWGSVGETVIPGCSLWFTLSVWESLLKARHLFRPDEIISATDVLPGMQTKQITVPDKPVKFGPFLGLKVDELSGPPSRRRGGRAGRRGGRIGSASDGGGRWNLSPVRPRLAVCLEFRLSALRVIIPGRDGYERDLLRHLGEDIPDQEIVKTTTHQHTLGFSTTQREVVASSAGGGRGGGNGEGSRQRVKIVDRRAKIGFHNGHTLVLPHEWVETHLEETDEADVLMLPEDVSSLNVDGYVAHPLFALVVLVEYTIRTRPKATASGGRGGGGRGRKGDPLSQAQAELSNSALPVVVGMQVFLPHDGKRLRLRNTPRDDENMDICLRLAADKKVRLVTTELVYTNKNHLLDEAHGGGSDAEDGRGPKMVYFDLQAFDSHGKRLEDETPASADESPLEANWGPPKEAAVESSDETVSSSVDSTSSDSSTESSSSESDASSTKTPKTTTPKPSVKRKPVKVKRKRPTQQDTTTSDSSSEESASPSLVQGDSDASFLRRRRAKSARKRDAHVQATDKGWDDWRSSIKVPRRSESLMGQTLQAPLHVEAFAQTMTESSRQSELGFNGPEAVMVGGFAPLPHGLSRASRTRLSQHGFTDVMKDTVDSFAQTTPSQDRHQSIPIDLDLEASDPLAKHEITLQFAAFRALSSGDGGGGRGADGGTRCQSGGGGSGGGMVLPSPTSLYFTYQFYTCLPTRTERMLLRPDGLKDRVYQAEGGGESRLSILVREGRQGRDEPSLGLRHSIDTTMMQPFEAQAFATYMADSALFVDVWDADALMHVGTLALPLRALMRQQKGVVKTAMEYEVVASTASAEDCGSGGGVAVKHGTAGKGPVIGLVQILASNYGEPGRGGDLPASGAVPGTVHPISSGPNMRGDWRLASAPVAGGCGVGQRGTRPRHKVRARPLSDTNPEISKYIEAVSGSGAGGGTAIASLGRRGRGDVDADSMGYDELMLLVRRFRGSVKGRVWYTGPLLKLLDVPGRKQLEQRLVRAVERSERSGLGLTEAFRAMDEQRTGEISTRDLEEMFWGMLSPAEMAREHLRALVKSMDPGGTGKIGLRELVTFIRARQGDGGAGKAGKAAEVGLKRALARAELGGTSVAETFSLANAKGMNSLSHAEFWEALRSLGGVPGLVKSDLDPLLRRLDTAGNGRVSLPALMRWAERKFLPASAVENAARKKILKAEAAATRDAQKGAVSIQEAFSAADDLQGALTALRNVHLTPRETSVLRRRFEAAGGAGIDIQAVLRFFGRDAPQQSILVNDADQPAGVDPTGQGEAANLKEESRKAHRQTEDEESRSTSEVERKLKNIVMKAESLGTSLAEVFGVFDKDGSGFITAAELEEGLQELRVFDTIPKDQVLSLVHKLKSTSTPNSFAGRNNGGDGSDGDLIVSAEEFVRFIGGEYEATEAAQGRLRRVLQLAGEKEGVTLEAAFGALDKDGTGNISIADLEEGLRQLKVFEGMSKEQASLATRRFDQNGDGTVSLCDFLAFAGRPYAANDRPLEAKLRRVLLKAEAMGTSMEEAFKHFDKDGCGSITAQGFSTGLREMGVFKEFSQEEVDEVISSFGGDGDGAVSLPKFLRFLGKEYGRSASGRRGEPVGGAGGGRSLAGRLRLILKKAHEMGTPLSASFDGFGADENGRVSAQQLHAALKDIGQFRWTTLGEVKGFIRLLQDDNDTAAMGAASSSTTCSTAAPLSSSADIFLTLPALEAFVEGGDAFLAQKERAALARRQSRDAISAADHGPREPTTGSAEEGSNGVEASASRPRTNSWAAEAVDDDSDNAYGKVDIKEGVLLERLRSTLAGAAAAAIQDGEDIGGGGGGRMDEDGVRGHLESFDIDGDGVLLPKELVAALRSLGARGGEFFGWHGVNALVSRFRDGNDKPAAGAAKGVSVVKLAWWFDEQESKEARPAGSAVGHRGSSHGGSGGPLSDAPPGKGKGKHTSGAGNETGGIVALRRAVRLAEANGTTLERTFARLDDDGDGFVTLRQLLRGLDQLGVFQQASRDDVLDALDELDADRQQSGRPAEEPRGEESKDGRGGRSGPGGVDLVAFIRLMRQRPRHEPDGMEETKGDGDIEQENERDAAYEYSLDPDTRAAEKKLRRVVAKQARLGVDVEGVFRRHDPEESGSILRSDFVQAVMELGVGLLDSSNSRHGNHLASSTGAVDPVRQRQLGQLARAKGPVERRLLRMRQTRRGLFKGAGAAEGSGGESKRGEASAGSFEEGDESLALIQWYREGQKKSMVRHILATSLTTEYNLFFAFASPLFFEHPLRNPFNHEERFRIDLDDHQLRVVTGTSEWAYLRRNVSPCVGDIGESPLETDFFDVDPERGVQITLMAHEVVSIPFAFLSLEPRRPASEPSSPTRSKRSPSKRRGLGTNEGRTSKASVEGGAGAAERSVVVAFVSTSHGHVVSVLQVHLQRRAFVVNRTFRFYQNEGEIMKRSIQLLPGGGPAQRLSKLGKGALVVGGVSRESYGTSCGDGAKYIHCVEEQGGGDDGGAGGGVVIEWARRAAAVAGGVDLQEVLVKCRVGQFPSHKSFYLIVYGDHYQGSLYETWHIIVQARLRMDVHSLLGQQSPADLVVRGDRYSRKVRAFSSAPAEVSFEPENAFQLVPGAYNRVELRFRPLSTGSRKIHVHLVDVDSMEIVGAWLATATAMPPVVTKSYEVDLPLGRACHKRIAYSNPWNSTRLFRLASSDPTILRPRYESLEVAGGGTGFLRLWFAAPAGIGAKKEAFLFVNDSEGQNEECLLLCMQA